MLQAEGCRSSATLRPSRPRFQPVVWGRPGKLGTGLPPAAVLESGRARPERAARRRAACLRGEGGIRTPDAGITDVTVFETAAFNHSATSPRQSVSTASRLFNRTTVCATALLNPVLRLPGCLGRMNRLPLARLVRPTVRQFGDKTPAYGFISRP